MARQPNRYGSEDVSAYPHLGLALVVGAFQCAIHIALCPLPGWAVVAPLLLTAGAAWWAGRRVRWSAGPDGLSIQGWLGPPRRLAWAEVMDIADQPRGLRLSFTDGTERCLLRTAGNFACFALRLREALREARDGARATAPLAAEDLSAALGLADDAAVVVRTPWAARLVAHPAARLAAVAGLIASLLMADRALAFICFVAVCVLCCCEPPGRLVASVAGLEVTHRRRTELVSWSDLRVVTESGLPAGWCIHHVRGAFVVPRRGPDADRLVALCRRAIALRAEGYALPAPASDVPARALSRLSGDEAEAVRGLSQADGGTP